MENVLLKYFNSLEENFYFLSFLCVTTQQIIKILFTTSRILFLLYCGCKHFPLEKTKKKKKMKHDIDCHIFHNTYLSTKHEYSISKLCGTNLSKQTTKKSYNISEPPFLLLLLSTYEYSRIFPYQQSTLHLYAFINHNRENVLDRFYR